MTVSRDDPRICRTPWPFVHLTLAEVIECEKLAEVNCQRTLTNPEHLRLSELLKRRYRPRYAARYAEPRGAA